MPGIKWTKTAVAVVAATLLAGCTAAAAPSTPSTVPPPSAPGTTATVVVSATPTAEVLSPADQIRVVDQAEAFLRALTRPASNRAAWWSRIKPYLSAEAAQRMATLQPSGIGFAHINGSGQLIPETAQDGAHVVRRVAVPTDVGPMVVVVSSPTSRRLISSFGPQSTDDPLPTTTTSPSRAADAALKKFATDFMAAFVKPAAGVTAEKWRNRIASMLTDDAADSYADITPAAVAARRVTGPVTVEPLNGLDTDDADIRTVTVGTDAGLYRLIVQLPSSSAGRPLVMEIQEP